MLTLDNPSLAFVDDAGVLLIVVFVCLSSIGMLNILIAQARPRVFVCVLAGGRACVRVCVWQLQGRSCVRACVCVRACARARVCRGSRRRAAEDGGACLRPEAAVRTDTSPEKQARTTKKTSRSTDKKSPYNAIRIVRRLAKRPGAAALPHGSFCGRQTLTFDHFQSQP